MKKTFLLSIILIIQTLSLFAQKEERKGIFYSLGAGLLIADNLDSYFYDGRPTRPNSVERLLKYTTIYEQLRNVLNDDIKTDSEGSWAITYPTMRYRPTAALRGQLGYKTAGALSFFTELEIARLTAAEAIKIELASPPQDPTKYSNTIEGNIVAKESRTDIFIGMHYAFGLAEEKHFFAEAGANITNTKVTKHQLIIESFKSSLINYTNASNSTPGFSEEQGGTGIGGFASAGYTLPINERFHSQILLMFSEKTIKFNEKDKGLSPHISLCGRIFF